MIKPLDRERLRQQFHAARPVPFIAIDEFLEPAAAEEIARCYPTFAQARAQGVTFNAVNEQRKVQITETSRFPDPVVRLNQAINSPAFLADLSYITGINGLLADEENAGGGMHITGPGGRLDVHVDFNYFEERKLHRRLNLLLYLNPDWQKEWGGFIELWDKDVRNCEQSFPPSLNRCLIFLTNEISYHGVTPVTAPPRVERKSYAAYYYTREPPPGWDGKAHSTVFRARPDERMRNLLLVPADRLKTFVVNRVRRVAGRVKRLIGSK
jgi:Rps23 Pro-64 3,4-dihydroxylase Tpa1-like proline 4-hydroxylase